MLSVKSKLNNFLFIFIKISAFYSFFYGKLQFLWGCSGFDKKLEMLLISVCVAQIYIKSWKKINANSENFGANTLALAA